MTKRRAADHGIRGAHRTAPCPALAVASAILAAATGCSTPMAATAVESPAHADPDRTGFGTGVSVAAGASSMSLVQISSSVVVAASSDPDGPSETHEGDTLWRVRGNMLEHCRWSADGADDCVLATVESTGDHGFISFLPTIIEPGNLGRGAGILVFGNGSGNNALVESLAKNPTQPVPFDANQTIWVSGGFLMPVYVCSVKSGIPSCLPLPLVLDQPVASFMLQEGKERVPVLWARGLDIGTKSTADPFNPAPTRLFRCEARAGKPSCKVAKETSQ
jgi:hypothetical protein